MRRFIKDVYFSRNELTQLQIQQLYINADGDYTDYFEFPLDEGEGDEVFDKNPLHIDAQIIQGAQWLPEDMQKFSFLDLTNEAGIIIEANDPLDYTFGKAYKTYTIQIANSGKNNLLLDNLFHKNLNKTLIYNAVLKINEIEFIGRLLIYRLTERGAEGQFITAAGNLWMDILDKDLKEDFDWSEYDHELTLDNIILSDDNDLFDGDIKYDYLDRGVGYILEDLGLFERNLSFTNTNSESVFLTLVDERGYPHRYADMVERQPAIRVRRVLEKIFDGYRIFQNALTEEQFDRLYYLYSQDQTRNTEDWVNQATASAYSTEPHQTTLFSPHGKVGNTVFFALQDKGIFTDENITENLDLMGTKFTATEDGAYRFSGEIFLDEIRMNLSSAVNFNNLKLVAELYEYDENDVYQRTIQRNETFVTLGLSAYPNLYFYDEKVEFDTGVIELKEGHWVWLLVTYQFDESADGGVMVSFKTHQEDGNGDLEFGASNFRVQPFQGIGNGGIVTGKWIVPNMRVTDVIMDFLKQYNAEIYVSEEKKEVYFYNRFISEPKMFDLTDRVLKDTITASESPIRTNYNFTYAEDGNDEAAERLFTFLGHNGNYFKDNNGDDTKQIDLSVSYTAQLSSSLQMINTQEFSVRHLFPIMRQDAEFFSYSLDFYETFQRAGRFKDFFYSRYSTDFNQRMAYYQNDAASTIREFGWMLHNTPTGMERHPLFKAPTFRDLSSPLDIGLSFERYLYERYHQTNIERLELGNVVECDIVVDTQFLYSMYLLTGRDMRSVYSLRIDGFDGVYQIISLDMKHDNIFKCRMVQVLNHPDNFSDENEQFDDEYYK